ncbi:Fanconi anemia group D2 protein [Lingula anatina]|uniref:Fanconi anemia group D2 protein n=1 Tax=Lingula anatina TaxID=7574 RepID=A0A1S3I8N1_LINAN|nr:Fanconi anemia group D2 protein [Lingula anatina]|eukprot:XP_013394620.1 Fanconi anemia group D2 protein [Lingula anatina]
MARSKRKSSEVDSATTVQAKRQRSSRVDPCPVQEEGLLGQLVSKAGLTIMSKNRPNELSVDPAVFQRNLTLALKRHPDFPMVVEEFISAIQSHIADQKRFYWSLMPTGVDADSENVSRAGAQDSLLRLLLGIDLIQPAVMKMLLEKLPEFTEDQESIFEQGEKVDMPKLIMNQFRWLDRIVNSKELTDKMMEIVSISSMDVQREVITCIPEVVDDTEHGEVALQLKDLLTDNNQLIVPILDALSNLSLKPELASEVKESVLQSLPSIELDDLPVVVKFLLQTVTSQDALDVVSELRNNLDFNSSFPPTSSSTPHGKRAATGRASVAPRAPRGVEALTLDAIKSAVRFQKNVAEAWIKAVESVKTPGEHKVIDILVLLVLHSASANRKKPVESLLRNKIRAGHFTELLLRATFGSHGQVLRDYFSSILSLAEVLLRSPEPAVASFGCAIYRHAFVTFDTYCQQEIVGNLVTHIGSGFPGEIDCSLDVLAELVENNLEKMVPFAIFVKGVLDYLDNLTMTQIRKLYAMLSVLAFRNFRDGGLIQDDMHILIRKQLSNNSTKYKKMGVIGAMMVVKCLSANSPGGGADESSTEVTMSDEMYNQVVSLLQLVRASSSKSPDAAGLFMDELGSVVERGEINQRIEAWISENVISDFQDDYVVDIETGAPKEDGMVPMTLEYGLDDTSEGTIAVNILPLVIQDYRHRSHSLHSKGKEQERDGMVPMTLEYGLDDTSEGTIAVNILPLVIQDYRHRSHSLHSKGKEQERHVSPLCLSPQFRVLQICERRQQQGDLEGIDALLGCPVYFPKPEVFEKFEVLSQEEKTEVCTTLFHTVNWFREVINAFATQNDPEMKGKVITRLQNITQTHKLMEKCLAATLTYAPPPAHFDVDDGQDKPVSMSGAVKKGKKTAGKGRKKESSSISKDDSDESKDSTQIEKDSEIIDKEDENEKQQVVVDLNQFRHFFRELDLEVFSILSTGMITKSALDSQLNTSDETTLQLQPPQLAFLLEDLTRKLSHSLIASASKRRMFLKVKGSKNAGFSHLDHHSASSVAKKVVLLLPALCDHLGAASGFFEALTSANDGVIDGPGSMSEEAILMGTCFQHLLQVLLTFFSWNGFVMAEHKPLLKEGLVVLASRMKGAAAKNMTFQELLKQNFQYLENFSGFVPNLMTAVTLVKLLVVMAEKGDSGQYGAAIAGMAQEFLKREWLGEDGQKPKGAKHNEMLQGLIQMYLSNSEDVLSAIEHLSTTAIPELVQSDKNAQSDTYPTLTRNSFGVYYRVILSELVVVVRGIPAGKPSDSTQVKVDKLIRWNLAVRTFHILVNLIKVFDARGNLTSIFKYGRLFVEVFLRQGMPLLDHMFRHHKDDVQSLLKNLQLSTRAIHHMCGHSKIVKDISLTNQVPPMKRCLELFVYRVKAMLTVNKCLEAFWMGNLKNRDLQGEEILSQVSEADTANAGDDTENDADSLPEDEDDDESEVELESNASNEKEEEEESYSEQY